MVTLLVPEPNVLALGGEIGPREAPRLRKSVRKALEQRPRVLFIDFTGVTFIDSSGLAVLVEALQWLGAQGGKLALYGIHGPVATVFHLARLDQVFHIYPHADAARRAATPQDTPRRRKAARPSRSAP